MVSIKNECARMGCENGRLISPLKKLVKLLVKISTGIATTYKFSNGLCRPTTLGGRRLVFSRALITNTYNRIKFTTPISEGEVICYNIGFFSEGAPGPSFDQEWQHKPI